MKSVGTNLFTLPKPLFWWNNSWSSTHIFYKCVTAFMENPAGWGTERMRSGTKWRAARLGHQPCAECIEKFMEARAEGSLANAKRKGQLASRTA